MIKKLRKKFIIIAMSSLALLIVLVVGTINIINYNDVNRVIDEKLTLLSENGGCMPDAKKQPQGDPAGQAADNTASSGEAKKDHEGGESRYKMRYYSVIISPEGNMVSSYTESIATVAYPQTVENAKKVISGKLKTGYFEDFKYKVTELESGDRLVVFYECSDKIAAMESFLLTSAAVSGISYCIVFVFVYFVSSRAIRPVAESMEKQKQFITDAGHELKTPLTVIAANVDVLSITQGANEWTDSIKKQIKRLNRLVKELVELSRLDEERRPLEYQEFSLSDAVEDIKAEFVPVAEKRGISVESDIQEHVNFGGDETAIRQLVSILMDNAVKYSDEGGKIQVSLRQQKHSLVFEISNTCADAGELEFDKLFDRFYRADKSRNSEAGGYGIGLSIARAVAEKHGGKISAHKTEENTVCFTVAL